MKPLITSLSLGILLLANPLVADEPESSSQASKPSLQEKLKENPNDRDALNAYMSQNLRSVVESINSDPQRAERRLAEMKEFLESLEPDEAESKQLLARARSFVNAYQRRLRMKQTSFEELREQLEQNPDNVQAISTYVSKLAQELSPIARSEPEKAEKRLEAAEQFLNSVKEQAEDESTKKLIERNKQTFAQLQRRIEAGKKLTALIGEDAAPLEVEAWVNGSPLTETDLKGKVVLLDFWAVWCGPCIATFPHLREWHEKYSDKGLVMIGITRYYNYKWDDEAGRATRAQGEVSPEQEQKMLEKFAEHHNLQHRFAIQEDRKMSEYYGVTGIPHVVVIDREGKVRMMRVGSGESNAKDIEQMLEKLLGERA